MSEKKGYSRRDFLKVVGATSGLAASGCAGDIPEKIIPYVVQPDEVVPGVAAWYSGTCGGCDTKCGVLVRTREGRAVKVEGNPKHPINQGKLCALGQSTLQTLYDPDRVREPLVREAGGGAFAPADWKAGIKQVADAIKGAAAGKDVVLLTGRLSGSQASIVSDFSKQFPALKHVEYDISGQDSVDLAAEASFGEGSRVSYDFTGAETIVSIGADFLETWISPVEFSRQWSEKRSDSHHPSKFFHVEPRLSLTAANADKWVMNAPGSELKVLVELLKAVGKKKGGVGNAAALVSKVESLTSGLESGVDQSVIDQMANSLAASKTSIVVAGGPAASGENAVTAAVLANAINSILGNVGKTVLVSKGSAPVKSSREAVAELIANAGKVAALIVSGVNPVYSAPKSLGIEKALSKIPFIATLAVNLDETAGYSNVILPASTSFESWSDDNSRPGLYSLNQPAMQPLYETQGLGDTLVSIAAALDHQFGEAESYLEYIQAQWKARAGEADFDNRWNKFVELGGDWSSALEKGAGASFSGQGVGELKANKASASEVLMAFPTIASIDGSSANRPWLQELPNPLTSVVWGSWAEIHKDKAKEMGVEEGDLIQVSSEHGAIEVPAYPTKNIHPALVAVPIGQGHRSMGRYANGIGVNPLSVLGSDGSRVVSIGGVRKGSSDDAFVKTQEFTNQFDRGIIRTVEAGEHKGGHHGEHKDHPEGWTQPDQHHKGGHHDLLALGPQDEPKQMYHQMEHVNYRWGMSIDLASCTGCSACVVACYAENNIPVVGKELCEEAREMSWLRIDRYEEEEEGADKPVTGFQPMMCQHCGNAPCEPVCPVYATYHNEEGLNAMVYNRCVGTRYCSNNCSYKVRRFNWFHYSWPEPLDMQLNPDVTVRTVGVMEKCSFCVQRIREGTNNAKNEGRKVKDGEIQTACQSTCPTGAITFGDLNDESSEVYKNSKSDRGYKVLDSQINTQPAVTYMAKVTPEGMGSKKKEHHEDGKSGGHH